jgi:hypothetical protein
MINKFYKIFIVQGVTLKQYVEVKKTRLMLAGIFILSFAAYACYKIASL